MGSKFSGSLPGRGAEPTAVAVREFRPREEEGPGGVRAERMAGGTRTRRWIGACVSRMTVHLQGGMNTTSSEKPSLTSLPPPRPARPLPWAPRVYHPRHAARSNCALLVRYVYRSVRLLQGTEHPLGAWLVHACIVPSAQHRADMTPRWRVWLRRGFGGRQAGRGREDGERTEDQAGAGTRGRESGCAP